MTTQQTTSPMLERLAELEGRYDHWETFKHADGSVTTVHHDSEGGEYDSPRDFDGNIATLISTSRDYVDLDSDDAGLSEARDRWHYGFTLPGARADVSFARQTGHDRETMVSRYVAIYRPDVAYYCDEWSVSGYSQSDWQGGWGYITTDALRSAGLAYDRPDFREIAEHHFDAEVKVYGLHFRGDYFYAVTLSPMTPELISETVDYAADPVDVYGNDYSEESCYGFLGYDSLADIAVNMAGELAS